MKRLLSRFLVFNLTLMAAVGLVEVQIQPVVAEGTTTDVTNALTYPTNSERFFEQGRQQFETEIHNLQHQALTQPPQLRIDPNIEQQQRIWQQQQEQQLEEIFHQPIDRHTESHLL